MAKASISGCKIAGICTSVPSRCFDNIKDTSEFTEGEVKKVVALAGVSTRRVVDEKTCSSDLCSAAARSLIDSLKWGPDSIDALIMVTQTPDYFLPQTSSLIHKHLKLSQNCAAFDVGLGCSGYPYGLWLASMMLKTGNLSRIILCHGDTPARYTHNSDRSVSLLFGDAGSATAVELENSENPGKWFYMLHTDSNGYDDMIIEGGAFRERFPEEQRRCFLRMKGANVFNFTLKRVPALISDTLQFAKLEMEEIDYFILHQSNQFIMRHLANKINLPLNKVPMILKEYGNTGGCSVPLTITKGKLNRSQDKPLKMMLVGYGVGLSWASALISLNPEAILSHIEL